MKKMLRLDEIEAQMALELPERDLMASVLSGLGAVTGNVGELLDKNGIVNQLGCLNLPINQNASVHTSVTVAEIAQGQITC